MGLCLTQTRSGKSRDYRDVIVSEKARFQNACRPHENDQSGAKPAFSNSSGLKNVFEKLRLRDRSVRTVGLTLEIKLCANYFFKNGHSLMHSPNVKVSSTIPFPVCLFFRNFKIT